MTITRSRLEEAIRVVREGRTAHGLYAYEDARADLKAVARYYWRSSTLSVVCVLFASSLVMPLLPDWRFYSRYFLSALIGVLVGTAITLALERLPLVGEVLAPSGLVASDVRRAMRYAYAPT